jgi:hypothetical protein
MHFLDLPINDKKAQKYQQQEHAFNYSGSIFTLYDFTN